MTAHVAEIAEIRRGDPAGLAAGVEKARTHFLAAQGCLGLALHRVVETPDTCRLIVTWRTVDDLRVIFRAAEGFRH